MLPNSRVFRSRWSALLWAAGIIWFAVDVAGTGGHHPHAKGAASTAEASDTSADDQGTRDAINALESIKG
jgi:hypothetical protein